jgi:3-isopropylmalate dehydrogenase
MANPLGTILSAALMFDLAFKLKEETEMINRAVEKSIEGNIVTEDLSKINPKSTSEVGDWLRDFILKN